jgi:hypothetical protein
MKSSKYLILLVFIPFLSIAQENEPIQNIREEIEENLSFIQEEFDWLINHKITLNEFLNNSEIYSIYINTSQHKTLKEYYLLNGEFIDLLELQSIEGFSEIEYNSLLRIIKTQKTRDLNVPSKIVFKSSYTHQSEIEKNYLGNQAGLQQRLNYQINNKIKLGISRENDVGESYHNYKYYEAFDHHSMFINYKRDHIEMTFGHFEVFYGQGLLIGQGFNSAMFSDVSNISSMGSTYRGIANSNEYNRFKGAAIQLKSKVWNINFALSSIKRDDGSSAGYHRTITELAKKRKNKDELALIELARNSARKQQSLIIAIRDKGLSLSTHHQLYFSNNKIINTELAYNEGEYACFIGLMILLNKNHSMSISRTYYSSSYNSLYMSTRVMGISRNDQEGYRIAYVQNLRHNFSVELLSILKKKRNIIEKRDFSHFNYRYEIVLRRVKKTGNTLSINLTYIDKYNNIEDSEIIELNQKNERLKIKYLIILDQHINVRYQIMGSRNSNNYSWSQSIQLNYKMKKVHISNTVCNYRANKSNVIYFHENSINGSVMSALNSNGLLNDLSILLNSAKGMKLLASIQNKYEYITQKNEQRIMIRIEIRC